MNLKGLFDSFKQILKAQFILFVRLYNRQYYLNGLYALISIYYYFLELFLIILKQVWTFQVDILEPFNPVLFKLWKVLQLCVKFVLSLFLIMLYRYQVF